MRATGPDAAVAPRWRSQGAILLVSCYELGHQPLGLAWPKAFLERAGYAPDTLDLSVEPFDEDKIERAEVVAISVPMHTALRLGGGEAADRIRRLNSRCRIVFYGLYALLNASYLLAHGADAVLGGEFEEALVGLVRRLEAGADAAIEARPTLQRLPFPVPSRSGLPDLTRYARLARAGVLVPAASVEASRGCLHMRSEEHTSELQSPDHLVCRLLLEKKKKT